jgi:hypothetical protein
MTFVLKKSSLKSRGGETSLISYFSGSTYILYTYKFPNKALLQGKIIYLLTYMYSLSRVKLCTSTLNVSLILGQLVWIKILVKYRRFPVFYLIAE